MKKLLLALFLSPLALAAQHNGQPQLGKTLDAPVLFTPSSQNDVTSPVQNSHYSHAKNKTTVVNATTVGNTNYDLQTNNAIARRIKVYSNGEISIVWTRSTATDQNFLDRGTGYAHYNGSTWINNTTRFEANRSGWPNIESFDSNGVKKELIVSHYAEAGTSATSGGSFWQENSAIGKTDFSTFMLYQKPKGTLWPRIAITGNVVHYIGVYNTGVTMNGIRNPVTYSRYNILTHTFEQNNILLPGYTSARYVQGSADEYSIDARDSIVAIVMGGSINDVALWKSTNYGKTWTYTIVDTFAQAPFDLRNEKTFDTTFSNDGGVNVTLDKNGNAHVFYPLMRVLNTTVGDSSYSYFPGTSGIVHWDETKHTKVLAGRWIDYDNSGTIDIAQGTTQTTGASYGGNALTTFPIGAVDDNNNIYMIYSCPVEWDLSVDQSMNFRDNYIVYSTDGGMSWSKPQDITYFPQKEDVFLSVARDAVNGKLHLTWMQDDQPGIVLVNTSSDITTNDIKYAAVNVSDILNNSFGLPNAGINSQNAPSINISSVYPNPTNGQVTVFVNVDKSVEASVRLVDMMGREIVPANSTMLTSGRNQLSLDLGNIAGGVYFCQITAGNSTTTQKIIKK